MSDNRETLAQAAFGRPEDELSAEEGHELTALSRGEPSAEEAQAEHEAQVRAAPADGDGNYAATLHRPARTAAPDDQLAAPGKMSADDVRAEYPQQSAQGVTQAAVSDKKATA